MRIFGLEISLASRAKMQAVDTRGGWYSLIRESFAGAWQAHVEVDAPKDILAFSGVFACVTKIAGDIAKMRPMLVADNPDGTCTEVPGESPFRAVLERPNHFQNRIKFVQQWVTSKLLHGNTYALKARDRRRMVVKLFILDPTRVTPLVTEDGDVYYKLSPDHLSGLKDSVVVPASEIIHDLMCPLWHPLVGVSPIYACGISATMGNRITRNSTNFFDNMSRPSGYLMAPGKLDAADAAELKRQWNENYGKGNLGGTAVLANGLTFKEGGSIPAQDAQLIEQLKWTIEDVARCYSMPAYKIGGALPPTLTVEALNQSYYSECLQVQIEDIELALKEGLGMPRDYYVEFDLDALMRMDTTAMVLAEKEAVGAGIKSPDESRKRMNLPPVAGGASPYMQQQNYSLAALAKRDAKEDPFKTEAAKPVAPPDPEAANDEEMEQVRQILAEIKAAIDAKPQQLELLENSGDEDVSGFAALIVNGLSGAAVEPDGLPASAALFAAARIQEDGEIRSAQASAQLARIELGQEELSGALRSVAATSERVIETLMLPVEPVYDARGKLKHAKRKSKEGEE